MSDTTALEMDILEMPLEGLAAYWLSLKKIMGAKIAPKTIAEEAEKTAEPFVKYLLELTVSGLDEASARRACERRRDAVLRGLSLKLALMREALQSIAASENPRMALARMFARLDAPAISEESATKMALDMVRLAEKSKDGYVVTVSTKLAPEELLVKLMFYVLWARREGKAAMEPFGENGRFRFFNHGMVLTADGHDRSFIKSCLDASSEALLESAAVKMDMAIDLALSLRVKMSYDDMFRYAQAYIS